VARSPAASFRTAALLLAVVLVALALRWPLATVLAAALLWLTAGAGAGALGAARRRDPHVDAEPRSPASGPLLVRPSKALLVWSAPAGLFAASGAGRGGVLALLWLAMTFAVSAGFNLGTVYRLAARRSARIRRFAPAAWIACFLAVFMLSGIAASGAAPTVPAVYSAPSATTRVDPVLTRAAQRLVEGRATVECFTSADWGGVERAYRKSMSGTGSASDRTIRLSPWVCDRDLALSSGAYRPSTRFRRLVAELSYAVSTLAHEAGHVRGLLDEAETTCFAIQHTFQAATLLGADPQYARLLAHAFRADEYPHMPDEYRSAECRPGGAYDLHVRNGWL
jgi:hypothetical protein